MNVRVAEHSNELYAFKRLSPRSCVVWMRGVGAVYELPKKVRLVVDVESLQLISAVVSIPSGHGGVEAREYIRLAFGRWRLLLWGEVHQGFWGGWLVVVRNACSMGPNRPWGSMAKGMRTIFLW